MTNTYTSLIGKPERKRPLRRRIDGRIILKLFKKLGGRM
jgi:hypothetical protein